MWLHQLMTWMPVPCRLRHDWDAAVRHALDDALQHVADLACLKMTADSDDGQRVWRARKGLARVRA